MRIHIIQHMPFETTGFLSTWANQPTNFLTVSHPYQTERYPALECFDLCIVLGGSMSAKDTFAIPPMGYRIVESEGCPNQGFLYEDHVMALQFNMASDSQSRTGITGNKPTSITRESGIPVIFRIPSLPVS